MDRKLVVTLSVIAVAIAVLLPLVAGPFWIALLTQVFIFGLLALSVDLLLGHAGLFSLCHAAFFSVAAYTTAILQVRYGVSTAAAAPAGIVAGTLLGMLFGLAVRTRGVYFILTRDPSCDRRYPFILFNTARTWSVFSSGNTLMDTLH